MRTLTRFARRAITIRLLLCLASLAAVLPVFAADTEYRQVRIQAVGASVRVRLPLTDVTGKVRPKQRTDDGNGEALAPTKTALGAKHYLEWQISYDTRDAAAPNVVKEIQFTRRGETKFGAELSLMLAEALRVGVISTNDLLRERDRLAKLAGATLEEREGTVIEKDAARHEKRPARRLHALDPEDTAVPSRDRARLDSNPAQAPPAGRGQPGDGLRLPALEPRPRRRWLTACARTGKNQGNCLLRFLARERRLAARHRARLRNRLEAA